MESLEWREDQDNRAGQGQLDRWEKWVLRVWKDRREYQVFRDETAREAQDFRDPKANKDRGDRRECPETMAHPDLWENLENKVNLAGQVKMDDPARTGDPDNKEASVYRVRMRTTARVHHAVQSLWALSASTDHLLVVMVFTTAIPRRSSI